MRRIATAAAIVALLLSGPALAERDKRVAAGKELSDKVIAGLGLAEIHYHGVLPQIGAKHGSRELPLNVLAEKMWREAGSAIYDVERRTYVKRDRKQAFSEKRTLGQVEHERSVTWLPRMKGGTVEVKSDRPEGKRALHIASTPASSTLKLKHETASGDTHETRVTIGSWFGQKWVAPITVEKTVREHGVPQVRRRLTKGVKIRNRYLPLWVSKGRPRRR